MVGVFILVAFIYSEADKFQILTAQIIIPNKYI